MFLLRQPSRAFYNQTLPRLVLQVRNCQQRSLEENQYLVKRNVMIKMHVTQDFDIRLPCKVAERKSQGFLEKVFFF